MSLLRAFVEQADDDSGRPTLVDEGADAGRDE